VNLSEQNTFTFYTWEYRHRGYYHFDTPIDIEPPYTPLSYTPYYNYKNIDDGRVHSIFKQITQLILPSSKEKKEDTEIPEILPQFLDPNEKIKRVGIIIQFPYKADISSHTTIELLNMLSFSEAPISFEIIGSLDDITIQIQASIYDQERIITHLQAYFPEIIIKKHTNVDLGFNLDQDIAICDFGLDQEFMRPINNYTSFHIDPLTSVIAIMDSLQENDRVVLQIIFKGITSPLVHDIHYSVSDGQGGSFFSDAPEMPQCARDKTTSPLFSVVFRIATQGENQYRSQYLAQELARNISRVSESEYNALIPLSNEGYNYNFHEYNLYQRTSNRLGFILNSHELATFVHYPNKTIVSSKLGLGDAKTKGIPSDLTRQKYILGINEHNGEEREVSLSDQMKLRHTHIIGATGVGKSTLMSSMMLDDIEKGNGCALFDPHGDIVEDILSRIPEHRKDDVIVIDPSDIENPIGFNILKCHSEAEKIVLSSDLVSAFRRQSNSWGDVMTAVLTNSVTAFLESSRGGTLIELKRFLLEERFRKEFLQTVDDPSIQYYWEREYPMVKKSITPLLTRIDIFLRPKIIRYMFAQQEGIDFRECIEEKKIVLIKLSQGLIGEQNSFLLASLFLTKFNQVAMGRQQIEKSKRHPFYIYCDEFQNYVTDSIQSILSGARKYGLGLILAHQELAQIDDSKILNSVISNPYTRICFRLGDHDAKRLESGFSYFEQSDLQNLGIGQAIARVGSSQHDFNLRTFPLVKTDEYSHAVREYIIENTREKYAMPKSEVEDILRSLLPNIQKGTHKKDTEEAIQESKRNTNTDEKEDSTTEENTAKKPQSDFDKQKAEYLKQEEKKETVRRHRDLQNYIKTMASQRGFKSSIEHQIESGERIDVSLSKDAFQIAIEISVTNSIDYEVSNIMKCLKSDHSHVCMISESSIHLKNIKKRLKENISNAEYKKVKFLSPEEFPNYLDNIEPKRKKKTKRIRGYRVKTNQVDIQSKDAEEKSNTLKDIVLNTFKKRKKK